MAGGCVDEIELRRPQDHHERKRKRNEDQTTEEDLQEATRKQLRIN